MGLRTSVLTPPPDAPSPSFQTSSLTRPVAAPLASKPGSSSVPPTAVICLRTRECIDARTKAVLALICAIVTGGHQDGLALRRRLRGERIPRTNGGRIEAFTDAEADADDLRLRVIVDDVRERLIDVRVADVHQNGRSWRQRTCPLGVKKHFRFLALDALIEQAWIPISRAGGVGRPDPGIASGEHLDGRTGADAKLPPETGHVADVEVRPRHNRDRLPVAVDAAVQHALHVVGCIDVLGAHARRYAVRAAHPHDGIGEAERVQAKRLHERRRIAPAASGLDRSPALPVGGDDNWFMRT